MSDYLPTDPVQAIIAVVLSLVTLFVAWRATVYAFCFASIGVTFSVFQATEEKRRVLGTLLGIVTVFLFVIAFMIIVRVTLEILMWLFS